MPESTTKPSADRAPRRSRWARARRTLRQAIRVDHWNVGLIRAPIESLLAASPPQVEWMPEPVPGRLNADPFGVIHEGRRYVLYEGLDYQDGRGFLAGREVGDEGWGPEFDVLREPFHLSYPYVVQHEGDVYLIPERFEAREIAIFRAVAFPERWERFATIRSDFCGIDSTVLHRDGRWWCWTTDREAGHDRRLQLLFADDLAGPWWPHPQNPVREEVRAARGAGTPFEAGGDLYRPGQDYSRKNEERITLNRVVELSTTRYHEETVAVIDPLGTGPYPDKLHTLSALGDWTLIDGCREVLATADPRMLRFKLRRIGRALSGLRGVR